MLLISFNVSLLDIILMMLTIISVANNTINPYIILLHVSFRIVMLDKHCICLQIFVFPLGLTKRNIMSRLNNKNISVPFFNLLVRFMLLCGVSTINHVCMSNTCRATDCRCGTYKPVIMDVIGCPTTSDPCRTSIESIIVNINVVC